jgi:fatty acid desaturase
MSRKDDYRLPPEVLKQLTQRSDARGLAQLGAHLAMLILAGIGLHSTYGSLFTVFKTRWLNDLVAAPIGFLLLLPFQYFRAFHYVHHRHTQNPELDPELLDVEKQNRKRYWLYLSGLTVWWQSLSTIWQHALGRVEESYIEERHHKKVINEARMHLAGYALLIVISLLASSNLLWWYWVLPALVGQPLLRLYLLAEHSGCDLSDNMLENSRTTYTLPWLNFLAWNMPYHAEHHYLASVPFYALPALHAYTGQRVKFKGAGYYQVNRDIAAHQ